MFADIKFAQSLLMQAQKHAVQKIIEPQVTIGILYCYIHIKQLLKIYPILQILLKS